MKISNKFKIFLILTIFSIFSIINSVKVSSNTKNSLLKETKVKGEITPEYNPTNSPSVIRELFSKIKKLTPQDSEIHDECVKLITNEKNMQEMKTFWDVLKVSQNTVTPGKIEKKFFVEFIKSTDDSLEVDGKKKDCKKIIQKNIMAETEIENENKQNELQTVMYPYFHVEAPAVKGKNIITAYLDIHRDSEEGRALIPKLLKMGKNESE